MNAILLCYANGENKENISKSATFLDKIKIQNRNHGIKSQLKQESKNSRNSREKINHFFKSYDSKAKNMTMLRNNNFHFCQNRLDLLQFSIFASSHTESLLLTINARVKPISFHQSRNCIYETSFFLSRLLLKAFKLLNQLRNACFRGFNSYRKQSVHV